MFLRQAAGKVERASTAHSHYAVLMIWATSSVKTLSARCIGLSPSGNIIATEASRRRHTRGTLVPTVDDPGRTADRRKPMTLPAAVPLARRLAGSGIPAEVHAPLGLAGLGDAIRLRPEGAGLWLEGAALRDERTEEGVLAA